MRKLRRRRGGRTAPYANTRGRDTRLAITKRFSSIPPVVARRRQPTVSRLPRVVEDRRRWRPDNRYPQLVSGLPAVQVIGRQKRLAASRLMFKQPKKVVLCVRRHQRKEVLFAKKVAGKRGIRKRTLNRWSKVTC